MTSEPGGFVWYPHEFPWLGDGFIPAIADKYADEFADQLAGRGVVVATMRCGAGDSFHEAIAEALNFPDYYGQNWNALHDCFRDIEIPHLFALVWRDAEGFAASDPKVFGEATAILTIEFEALRTRNVQATLLITGDGPTFRQPESAST